MEQQQEATPLQPVKDCCRRLKQEWEDMLHSADIASTEMLSSLKAQEAALVTERTHVLSLRQETDILRSSFLMQTQEQERKASAERSLADQIRRNIQNQLVQVKQMQCQLANQLADTRTFMENLRKPKQEEELANSVALPSARCELLGLEIVVPLEDEESSPLAGSCGVSNPSDKVGLEADNRLSSSFQPKDSALKPQHYFEQSYANVKIEGPSNEMAMQGNEHEESRVKPLSSLQRTCDNGRCQASHISVKAEPEELNGALQILPFNGSSMAASVAVGDDVDEIDNILLSKRLELLVQQICNGQFTREECLGIPREPDAELLKTEKLSGPKRNSLGKRKRDVPIEVALQEDAPGLLEKLVERGLMEDMIIYGALCENEWDNGEDHFKDLECIASKIWGTPSGLFKQPSAIRQHMSGLGKAPMYCLSCLVSLIDQAKALRQRSWPVEWGWCRDLQAFIFVFDKHNRIVLERPEYGNATYFFELVQFLPMKWQVLRLIRVLSVTALGKAALLENRPLEVGYELTADESKILEYYGWAPSTGLGSFLNFCDRVIHDVYQDGKDEDNLEWRQRIGKCLMDGYDRGRIITPTVPPHFLKIHGSTEWEDIKPNTTLLT